MKTLKDIIVEKLKINAKSKLEVENYIDMDLLKYFTKNNVKQILDFVNSMPNDIKPVAATNILSERFKKINFPACEIFFFFDDNYFEKDIYELSYFRFWYSYDDGMCVDIYDPKTQRYLQFTETHNRDNLQKRIERCCNFVKKKYRDLQQILEKY